MEKNNSLHGKVVVHPASIEVLANATWDFAKRILWGKFNFGEDEILLAKSYIREHYEDIPPERFQKGSYYRFESYCRRIIAAKQNYWNEFTHPCIWFNKLNPEGFSKSVQEHWRELNEHYRANVSFYNELMKDPMLREIFRNDDSFKPLKPNLHGDRCY